MFFTSQMQKLFFLVFSQECNHLLGNKQFFTENVYFEKHIICQNKIENQISLSSSCQN